MTHNLPTMLIFCFTGIQQIEKQGDTCWDNHYNIVFSLYKIKSELEYLLKNFEAAEEMYPGMLERARTIFDKTDVYVIMLGQYEIQVSYHPF
jgi:predicted ATPase